MRTIAKPPVLFGALLESEKIEYAAIRLPDGRLFWSKLGHFDCAMQAMDEVPNLEEFEEGFITSMGRFVDRVEAYNIATASKQVEPNQELMRHNKAAKELSSEDTELDPVELVASLQRLFPKPVLQEGLRTRAALKKIAEAENYWYHGTPAGTLTGGTSGLHLGTLKAAREALYARIGMPAEGEWDGTREYGKTLLAGKKKLLAAGFGITGFNCDVPEEDFYAADIEDKYKPRYSGDVPVPLTSRPNIIKVLLRGKMTNAPHTPLTDIKANATMTSLLKRNAAKRGYFYRNDAEDYGSISAVVPGESHVIRAAESGTRELLARVARRRIVAV